MVLRLMLTAAGHRSISRHGFIDARCLLSIFASKSETT